MGMGAPGMGGAGLSAGPGMGGGATKVGGPGMGSGVPTSVPLPSSSLGQQQQPGMMSQQPGMMSQQFQPGQQQVPPSLITQGS